MRAMFSSPLNLTVRSHQKRHRRQTQPAAVHFQWQLATKRFRHLSSSERCEHQKQWFKVEQSSTLCRLAAMPLKHQPIWDWALIPLCPHSYRCPYWRSLHIGNMRNDIFHYICQIDALPAEELYHKTNVLPAAPVERHTSWHELAAAWRRAASDHSDCRRLWLFWCKRTVTGLPKNKATTNVGFRLPLKVVGSNESAV